MRKGTWRSLAPLLIAGAAAFIGMLTPATAGPKHFVLVHGAWHTGAAWDGVIDGLRKRGYTAEAITLPGYGPNNGDPSAATLADDTAALVALLEKQTAPIILVAHSAGGVVVQQAVPKAPAKIAQVVFFDAFLAGDGKRLLDSLPPDIKTVYEKTAAANHNTLPVPEELVRHVLMPDDSKPDQDMVIGHLVAQPYGYYTGTVDAAVFAKTPVKRGFLFAKDDKSLPPGAFKGMIAALGAFDEVDIPGGHEVIFTNPDAVAEGLAELAQKIN
ncbi:MAG: alpha/beta hydrolase [Xanthobacteraceae bacterium]